MRPIAVLFALCLALPVAAEEIRPPFETELREAVNAYRKGDFEKAREHTTKALVLLDDLKTDTVTSTLPEAPEGWQAGKVQKDDVPAALGGGRVLRRSYVETGGLKRIELEVILDTPWIKLLMGLLVSDEVAKSQGFELCRVGRDKALIKPGDKGLELNMPIEENLLVKLVGNGGVDDRDLIKLAREVDRAALRRLK